MLLSGFEINNANRLENDNTDYRNVDVNEIFGPEEVEKDVEKAESMIIEQDSKIPSTRSSYGSYPTRKVVILVTPDKYKNLIPTDQVPIIYINFISRIIIRWCYW